VGNNLASQAPAFDSRNYGYKELGELVAATRRFEIEERQMGDGQSKSTYIKDKRKR